MVTVVAAVMVAACGGYGTTEPTPAIEIGLSSGTLTVTQDASTTVNLSLTRSGGFAGDVSIVIDEFCCASARYWLI